MLIYKKNTFHVDAAVGDQTIVHAERKHIQSMYFCYVNAWLAKLDLSAVHQTWRVLVRAHSNLLLYKIIVHVLRRVLKAAPLAYDVARAEAA